MGAHNHRCSRCARPSGWRGRGRRTSSPADLLGELPGIGGPRAQVAPRLPAKSGPDPLAGRDEDGGVAWTAGRLGDGDVATGDIAADVDDLAYRGTALAAEVVDLVTALLTGFQRPQVSLAQVGHVNVIANA